MKLTRSQILLISVVIIVVVTLFIKGYKSSTTTKETTATVSLSKEFDFQEYLLTEKARLGADQQEKINSLEKVQDKQNFQQLIVLWDSLKNPLIAAHYSLEYAGVEPTEKNWFAAGIKYYGVAASATDSLIIGEAAKNAEKAFEKVLALNPNNLEAKTALASCYIQIDQDVMKGVGMLKEVIEKDSNNVQAIYTLGMLSIQSGQLDKAQQRFEKLVSLQPFNPEFYFYLGEVYAKLGESKKAIATYEKCKTLLSDKEAKKEIETLINKLKNI